MLDLATAASTFQLERAVREAIYQHETSLAAISRCLSNHHGERGAAKLRRAIDRTKDAPGHFRSGPEQRFANWLRRRRLQLPQFNAELQLGDLRIEADCYWPGHALIAEIDHRGTHAQRQAFESDRARDRRLQAHGLRIVRVTEPFDDALHADLVALLQT